MKQNKRSFIISLALILAFSLSLTAVASALNVRTASIGSDADVERGDAWEALNNQYCIVQDLLNEIGNDFTDYYDHTVRKAAQAAETLLNSPSSTTAQLREMEEDLRFLLSERNNPANHTRYGCHTVAFTNDGSWSDPIYLYNWSDDGGEIAAWPGETMRGGYINEYGQKQYYAFVPMDVPNIVISTNHPAPSGSDDAYVTVRLQTVDIFVHGNTGYYLTGAREGAKYKVAEWELKDPVYKTFDDPDPTEPPTPKPTEKSTEQPTQEPTAMPTEPTTEKPTVKADPVTEPSTEFDIDDYIPSYGGMLEFYEHSVENLAQKDLREIIVDATQMLAPGNDLTPEHIEKVSRVRNFAVTVYNDDRSSENELIGARKMLQAAFEDKSYEEIVGIMYQWFNMPDIEVPDPTTSPTPSDSTEGAWENDPIWNHIVGDADGDGEISVLDATRIQRVLADFEQENRVTAERYARMTGSELSILDATAIQRYLAGYPDIYGVGSRFLATGLRE